MSQWRRAFVATVLVAAVLAGAIGAAVPVGAQEGNQTGSPGGGDGGPPIPDTIALYGLAAVLAVLSPIAFAIFLALRYRGE